MRYPGFVEMGAPQGRLCHGQRPEPIGRCCPVRRRRTMGARTLPGEATGPDNESLESRTENPKRPVATRSRDARVGSTRRVDGRSRLSKPSTLFVRASSDEEERTVWDSIGQTRTIRQGEDALDRGPSALPRSGRDP